MAVRAEHFKSSRREEVVWVLIAATLFVWEIRSIIHDRNEHDRTQVELIAQQRRGFENTRKGIETAIGKSEEGFRATIDKSDKIFAANAKTMGLANETLSQLTGSDSYLYFAIPIFINASGFPNNGEFPVLAMVEGKHAMQHVSAELYRVDQHKHLDNITLDQALNLWERIPMPETVLPGPHMIGQKWRPGSYTIRIFSTNGEITESLDFHYLEGQVVESMTVTRGKQVLEKMVDGRQLITRGKPLAKPR